MTSGSDYTPPSSLSFTTPSEVVAEEEEEEVRGVSDAETSRLAHKGGRGSVIFFVVYDSRSSKVH